MKDKQAETSQENVFLSRLEKDKIKLAALEDYKRNHEEEDTEAEQMCEKQRKVVAACRAEIKTAILQLNDPIMEAILIRKYLNMEQVQDIANHMHYSERAINYKLQEARRKFADNCSDLQ